MWQLKNEEYLANVYIIFLAVLFQLKGPYKFNKNEDVAFKIQLGIA